MTKLEPPPASPTDFARRIHSLDVLRGLALLGMLVVHFHVRSSEPGGFEEAIRTLIWRMVESKSHGTFALLFGAGFALQLRRAEERGGGFVPRYLRRLGVLALFGFAAHAFFGFNVLLGYAAWGVGLLLIRTWPTRALLATAVLCTASVSLYHLAMSSYVQLSAGPDAVLAASQARRIVASEVMEALHAAEAQDGYRVLLAARMRHMAWFYTQPFSFMPGATLALFIAGLLFVRHRVFERAWAHRRLLIGLSAFGVISWLGDNWLLPLWGASTSFGLVRDQWLTFSYVGVALLLFAHQPGLIGRLRPVASAGRMALTNYLIQIAALDVLFSAYAVGLAAPRPIVALAAALTCFAVEATFSTVWLTHFQFGPAEWLWRALSLGRMPPMRRAAAPATPAAQV